MGGRLTHTNKYRSAIQNQRKVHHTNKAFKFFVNMRIQCYKTKETIVQVQLIMFKMGYLTPTTSIEVQFKI